MGEIWDKGGEALEPYERKDLPLAQVEDVQELIFRYRVFSDQVLERWREVVTGPHREAIEAILRRREEKRPPEK